MPSLVDRLKERKLAQWALAYLAGCWVAYEVLDVVGGRWGLPDVLYQGLFLLMGFGFLIILVLAWYHSEKGRQRVSGPELLMIAGILVAAGLSLSWLANRPSAEASRGTGSFAEADDGRLSIAVLPFDNLSPRPEDAYFADGITEEITSRLAKVGGLSVRARTSVMQYRVDRPPVARIAEELNVGFLVEGTARLAEDEVRLTVQLIDARRDEHVWSEEHDLDLSAERLFDLQSSVAQQVAFAIGVSLSPEERDLVARVLTENTEAYLLFLRGNGAFSSERAIGSLNGFESIRLYERAVELDPGFAHARARLALSLTHLVPDEQRLSRARSEAEQALSRWPGLADAMLALGRHDITIGRGEEALIQFEAAVEESPDLAAAVLELGYLQAMSGEFDAAIGTFEGAERLDPQNAAVQAALARSYIFAHRYGDALRALDRLEDLALRAGDTESVMTAILFRAWVQLLRGSAEEARSEISRIVAAGSDVPYVYVPGLPMTVVRRVLSPDERAATFTVYDDNRPTSERRRCTALADYCLRRAIYLDAVGRGEDAHIYWDSLRVAAEARPVVERFDRIAIALIYQALGDKEAALRAAESLVELNGARMEGGVEDQFYHGPNGRAVQARILAHFGEYEAAIDLLEELLPAPSWLTVHVLEVDPIWDPLRDRPRFQTLLVDHADDVEY